MKETNKQDLFESIPVSKAIAKLAIPTILAMLVTVIYSLADTFFVGKVGDPNQVAAITIASPIFIILMSLGSFFGAGSSSYISRMLGIKNYGAIKSTSSFCFYASFALGILVLATTLPNLNSFIYTLGVSNSTFEFTKDYSMIILMGSPTIVASFCLSQMIRAEGAAKESIIGMILGDFLNIILDPIFIIWFKMGVVGAALATVISNVVAIIYYIIYLTRKTEYLSISPKHFKFDMDIIKNLLVVGIPALLTNVLISFSTVILNNYATHYGENVIAALGIVRRILLLPMLLLVGLSQGVMPLIGYNYSSKNYKRMNEAIKKTAKISMISAIVFTVIMYLISKPSIRAFIDNNEIVELGSRFLRINLISIPCLGVLLVLVCVFQAFGKGLPTLILSISRQGFVFIPVIIIGAKYFGIDGIVFSQPISDVFSVVMAVITAIIIFKKEKLYTLNSIK